VRTVRNFLANAALSVVSVVVCVVLAEGIVRLIDGQSPITLMLPEVQGAQGVDTTGGHLDRMPRADGVDRAWFFQDPPPLPNRTAPPAEWIELDKQIQRAPQFGPTGLANPFLPWDMFKAWNSVFVGDVCKHDYLKGAPGRLWVFDPADGKPRPTFRFLPNATVPDGLVTNAYGWRGPPVPFKRSPRTIRIVFVGASTVAEIHPYPYSGPEYLDHWLNLWARAKKLDLRFEVMNAGRESINSNDLAAIVRQEVAPLRPDLVVYYEGGNQLQLATVVKEVPKGVPQPPGRLARWLRQAATWSALARRAEGLTVGNEWPKPPYEIVWPNGLDENDPDLGRPDLPVHLSTIIRDLDSIRADLAKVDGELSVATFHWLAKDGLVLNAVHHKPILETLNIRYYPYLYRDLERLTAFENRVFAKYDKVHGLPLIDVARYMPYDPNLFSDAIHNTPAGVKLRAWIQLQELVPIIEKKLQSGAWPKPVPEMGDTHPAFTTPPREIRFDCRKAS
jgi:hypothetical protein